MLYRQRRKKWVSMLPVLLLAFGLGWLLYRFIFAGSVSLRDTFPSKPSIVSRSEWGARPINLKAPEEFGLFDSQTNPEGILYYPSDLQTVLNTIVIHHSAFAFAGPVEIQGLHMERRGYADVAYHFVIDSDGTIYEGREIGIRGAHVQGFNTGSIGIVLLGNFNETKPTQSQLDSLGELADYLRDTYGIRYLAGHKDYPNQSPDGTECPGDSLYPLLSELARDLGMIYGIEGYVRPDWIE